MLRVLALLALSLLITVIVTVVVTLIARPEERSAVFDAAGRWREEPDEKEVPA